ncbi:glycosyltransferase family 2 protein [Dothidotthia symphoricarpi CBS 119687]|uniref:Glycosyltransferase family 2 protein n=1 Tax=Dothidotthia symphoricarpi CBS 119687 TaxID=1392245 RepID=A0A6A6ATS1_9PLEO|nr:glycosyltransferase family 2 protein [Dothidotthia symphoricarpi CBS 119687]KAF2134355.1 glycosyltransferase family 2 protein [Dothidotthia symphoricarpi CBS 119687]
MDYSTQDDRPHFFPPNQEIQRPISFDSDSDRFQNGPHGGLASPMPSFQRPISYGQKSHSSCTHCGNLTPRYGSTTVYGTPLKQTPATSTEQVDKLPGSYSRASSYMQGHMDKQPPVSTDPLCLVERVHASDDIDHLPTWKRRINKCTPLFSLVAVASYWVYFVFRIKYTLAAQAVANRVFAMAWTFIAVEMGVALPMLCHQFWQLFLIKGRRREKLRIVGDTTPTVDVFVTCCKEDVGIITDTVRAAAAVDWPTESFRVIVLDDGADAELAAAVNDVSLLYPNVYYTARQKIKGVPHHFKAGNLNHGLEWVAALPGGASTYIAALDADMIPEPEWLRAVLAHLVIEPQLALSCPPQLFYNVPKNDPLMQSLDSFVHISEPVKDAAGVAWCTGSGYAIRRAALDGIGGFPTGSLAEDVCCSSVLLGAGWKTAYVHEPLQYGTVPESFGGHIKQRTRWTIGTVQTSMKLNFCLWGPLVTHMSIFQRLSGFVYTISSLFTIFLTASLLTMPIVLVSGGTLIAYANNEQLRLLLRLCFVALVANRLNEWVMTLPAGYRLGQRDAGAMMWMAPYHAITIIRAFFLPKFLGGKTSAFSSSGSQQSELNERDPIHRAGLFRRLRVIIFGSGVFIHLFFILFCIAAVTVSTAHGIIINKSSVEQTLLFMLTHACWPPLLWLIALNSCWAPIHYAIWPPNMPDREELLDRDPKTGIAYPKESSKKLKWEKNNVLHEMQYFLLTAYTTVLFVGTFFY